MNDRAALYTVSVRPRSKGGEGLPFGDLDGAGTSLSAALAGYLADFLHASKDGTSVVRSLSVTSDGDDLFAVLQHGQSGVAADIVDRAGAVRLRQTPDDLQLVRYGCLFRLPPAGSTGRLAVHVHNGRGLKGLFEQGLTRRFRAQFPRLTLAIERLVEGNVLRDAVEQNRIDRVRLVRLDRPGDRALAATDKWVADGATVRVEVDVATRTPGARIRPALIQRYLGGDESAFAEIVEFGGMTFDEAKVEVLLADNTRRLFDIAHPEVARPLTRAMPEIDLDADGEPTAASLLAGLRAALD
jgi:hypothetical protein